MDDLLKALEKRIKQPVMSGDERHSMAASSSDGLRRAASPSHTVAALPADSENDKGQSGPRSAGLVDIE